MQNTVLLNLADEPRYHEIATADIKPAMQTAMEEARRAIADIKQQPQATWLNTVERLTDITERVGRIWGVVAHLNSVVDTPELRAEYNALMPEVTVFFTEIGQDIELYERFKAIKASPEFEKLDSARQTKLAAVRPCTDYLLFSDENHAGELEEFLKKRLVPIQPNRKF